MEPVYLITLLLFGLVAWGGRRVPTRPGKIFEKSAILLFRLFFPEPGGPSRLRYDVGKWHGQKETAIGHLKALYPGRDLETKVKAHGIEKIRLALLIIFIGNLLSLGICLYQKQDSRVSENGTIKKNSWAEGDFSVNLTARSDRIDTAEEITVTVQPQSLAKEEAARLAEEVFSQLPAAIRQHNAGLKQITGDLKLVSRWDKYPFQISWESDRPQIVSIAGEVDNAKISPTGEPVILTAQLRYQGAGEEYFYRKEIPLWVYPPVKSPREEWQESLYQAVADSQQSQAYGEILQLPATVQGRAVGWQEKGKSDSIYLWLIFLVAAGAAYLGQDNDLRKKVKERNRQTEQDYPELVRKLALYLGAGMTVKNAWKRMTEDYGQRENRTDCRILYEEMLVSLRELENGRPESDVYFRFGKRLGGNRYRKLSGLLCGHLQKGNQNLLRVLREEADLALEERKNAARALGEEMGTKLLFPMMIMLVIVMVFIMVPAYSMF